MSSLVEILITAKDLSEPAFAAARGHSEGLAGTLSKMGTVASAALIGIGVEAVKMAASYENSTARLVTSAGESRANLDMVRKGMLAMSSQVGVGAEELSKAMYYVEAAGYHGADGLKVLKAAAQGAAAEGADTTHVAQALTDVLKDYGLKASQAGVYTSKMIEAVAHGKTNLEDFSKAFASIVPAASAAGISFDDVGAALSNMTNHGFTAQRGAQNLAQALRSLLNPTKPMQKAFDEFGVSAEVLKQKLNSPTGLTDAMQYLSQAASKAGKEGTPAFAAALKLLMGTAAGANAALATTGQNFTDTTSTINDMGKATTDAAGNVQGFALVQQTAAQQWKELEAGAQAFLITLGSKLLPVLSSFMTMITSHQGSLDTILNWGLKILGVFAGYKLAVEGITLVTRAWAIAQAILNMDLDANPIGLIAGALVLLGIAFYEAWQHSEKFRRIVLEIASILSSEFLSAVKVVIPTLKAMFDTFMTVFTGIAKAIATVASVIPGLGGAAKGMVAALQTIHSTGDTVFNGIISLADQANTALQKAAAEKQLKMNIQDAQAKINTIDQQIKGMPASKTVQLLANKGVLEGQIVEAQAAIDKLHGKTVVITYQGVTQGYSGPGGTYTSTNGWHYAAGGAVTAAASGGARNGMVLVGEQGPELVRLPGGSTVTPAGQTRSMLAGGGGAQRLEIEWVGGNAGDPLFEWIRHNIRIRGGNVQTVLGQGY